jgi:hypothetical protein
MDANFGRWGRRRNDGRMKDGWLGAFYESKTDGLEKDRNGKNHSGVRFGNFTFFLTKRPNKAGFDMSFCVQPSPESVICDIVRSSTSFKPYAPG